MIHIAEAGEAKGRVIVHSSTGQASPVALEAAIWLAKAFQSEIEGVYVENAELVALASHPVAREVSLSGRSRRGVDLDLIEREFRYASAAFHRSIEALARAAEVGVRARVVRKEPISALNEVCADCGPWNAVALAEPFTAPGCPSIKGLLDAVRDMTGLLVVGPRAQRVSGPIVIALEREDLLSAMLGAADRLSSVGGAMTAVLLAGRDEEDLAALEAATRLVLTEWPTVKIAGMAATRGSEAALAEALRRLQPGLVMGQFGGVLMSEDGDVRPLAVGLECPLLLLR